MNWFFTIDGDVVHLNARLEDVDTLADAHAEVRAGEEFFGVSYDDMRAAESGVVVVDEYGFGHLKADDEGDDGADT